MTKFILVISVLISAFCFSGCSKEDQKAGCYTIRINGIDSQGTVSGSIINMPEESFFIGHSIILFDRNDLQELNVSDGDILDVIILSSKEVPVEGFTTGETYFYDCKVNICK